MNPHGQTTRSIYGRSIRRELKRLLLNNELAYDRKHWKNVMTDDELRKEMVRIFPTRKWVPECWLRNMNVARRDFNNGLFHTHLPEHIVRRYRKNGFYLFVLTPRGRVITKHKLSSDERKQDHGKAKFQKGKQQQARKESRQAEGDQQEQG